MGIIYGYVPGSKRQPKKEKAFTPLKTGPVNLRMEEYKKQMAKCPSHGVSIGNATVTVSKRYDDEELAAREEAARTVKHTVAPICNKGAYQLITGDDVKTMGRKV